MTYLIRRKELLTGEVRRILTEQNRRARVLLEHWQQNPRERVHSARQAFKRLRALLRLIRPGARYVYEVENRFYRDLAHSLAYVRDTEAVIEALAVLETNVTDPESRESLQLLRTGLQQRAARELADPVLDVPRRVQTACDALRDAAGRLRRTPLPDVNRKVLRSAVRKTLRRCEAGFGQVLITGAAADFHAWRRDVKYAYHQTRLMQELMPEWAASHGPLLARLGELLGHSQDLTVLDALLREQPDELGLDRRMQHLREVIRNCQRTLQEQARQLGAQIFLQPVREPRAPAEPEPGVAVDTPSPAAGNAAPVEAPPAEIARLPANVVDFASRKTSSDETS
jgi:hypothetical protein